MLAAAQRKNLVPSNISWQLQQRCQPSLLNCPHVNDTLEFQARLILDRVESTQGNFGNLCKDYASYTRKIAEIRDCGDELSRNFSQFTEVQSCCCPQTKNAVLKFADALATVQDYEQARISRIEAKVISGFAKYGFLCHTIKDEVHKGLDIREREQRQAEEYLRFQADITLSEPMRQQKLESANLAANDTKRAQELLQRRSDKFEQQKLEDMRRVLLNFCEIEIAYHAKVIELYTIAYDEFRDVNIDVDLDTFRMELQIGPAYMKACETVDEKKAAFQKEGAADGLAISSTHSVRKPEDEFSDSNISAEPLESDSIVKRLRMQENQTNRCAMLYDASDEDYSDEPSNYALAGSELDDRQVSSSRTSFRPNSGSSLERSKLHSSQSLLEQLATKDSHSSYRSMKKEMSSKSLPSHGRRDADRNDVADNERHDVATGMSRTERLLQEISSRNLNQLHPASGASLRMRRSRTQVQQQQSSTQWYPSEVSNIPRPGMSKTASTNALNSTCAIGKQQSGSPSVTNSKYDKMVASSAKDLEQPKDSRADAKEQDLREPDALQPTVSVSRNDTPMVSNVAHRLSIKQSSQRSGLGVNAPEQLKGMPSSSPDG